MKLISDARHDKAFKPPSASPRQALSMKPTLKYGMSVDSPFHSAFTKTHPATKKLQDYGDVRKSLPCNIDKLPIDEQMKAYSAMIKPKMFTNIMREGLSKDV